MAADTGLATIHLDTNEGALIDTRDRWFEGEFTMTAGAGCEAVAPATAKFRGRGNTTWDDPKKPYNVNLENAQGLCGLGANRKWTLLANGYDYSLLRTAAAMFLGAQLEGLAWTPAVVPVDLYVNGAFKGAYVLIERVMIDPGRIAIHELKNNGDGGNDQPPEVTGGYLLEWDDGETADHNVLVGADRGWVGIREPEDEDDGSGITATQVDYIDRYLDDVDAALFGANFTDPELGWRQYIDVASAVDYYLAMELTKVDDGNMYGSVMMYKARDTNPVPGDQGELFFGPLWDFDASIGIGMDWVGEDVPGGLIEPTGWYLRDENPEIEAKQSSVTWFNRLNQDPGFRALVAERWREVRADLASSDTYLAEQQGLVEASAIRKHMLWEGIGEDEARDSWTAEVAYMRTWLQQRIAWIDSQYS